MSWLGIIGSRGGEREDALDKGEGVVDCMPVVYWKISLWNTTSRVKCNWPDQN